MAGTLIIRKDTSWMPANWVFDATLAAISAELAPSQPGLAAAFAAANSQVRGYLDLAGLSTADFHTVVGATDRAYQGCWQRGPEAFTPPTAFAGFMALVTELRLLVQRDERAAVPCEHRARIIVHEQHEWRGPHWIAAFLLEQLAALVVLEDRPLTADLLACAVRSGQAVCDLSALPPDRARPLAAAVPWLLEHYCRDRTYDTYAPGLMADLKRPVQRCARLLLGTLTTPGRVQ